MLFFVFISKQSPLQHKWINENDNKSNDNEWYKCVYNVGKHATPCENNGIFTATTTSTAHQQYFGFDRNANDGNPSDDDELNFRHLSDLSGNFGVDVIPTAQKEEWFVWEWAIIIYYYWTKFYWWIITCYHQLLSQNQNDRVINFYWNVSRRVWTIYSFEDRKTYA